MNSLILSPFSVKSPPQSIIYYKNEESENSKFLLHREMFSKLNLDQYNVFAFVPKFLPL